MEDIHNKADMILNAVNTIHSEVDERVCVSASIGVAVYPDDGMEFEELFKKADVALYETKKNGKNGYTIFREN